MRCQRIHDHLSAYGDGELRRELAVQVEQHLAGCGPCSEVRTAMRHADRTARELLPPEQPLSPTFIGDLERRIAREADRPALDPAGGGVRALIPMAAAVLLGATLTFAAMRVAARGAGGSQDRGDGTGNTDTVATEASDYASFVDTRDRFASASDLVLTNIEDLGSSDPGNELTLVRNEVAAAGVRPAIAEVRERMPVARQLDPRVAQRLQTAAAGMETVLLSLEQPGAPAAVLLEARKIAQQLRVAYHIRSLVPEGLPRPMRRIAGTRVLVQRQGQTGVVLATAPNTTWLRGVRFYSVGQIDKAQEAFEQAVKQSPSADQRARAAYWATRCLALQNKSGQAAPMIRQVAKWRPETAAKMLHLFAETADGGRVDIVFSSNGMSVKAKGQKPRRRMSFDLQMPGRLRKLQRELQDDWRDLERELLGAARNRNSGGPNWLVPVEEILAVRADGQPVEARDGQRLRQVMPVMLGKFLSRGLATVATSSESSTVTLSVRVRDLQFATWEAKQFVSSLGGDTAAKLRGGEQDSRSTLGQLEFDLRFPKSLGNAEALWMAFRRGGDRPPTADAPDAPKAPRAPEPPRRHKSK